MKETFKKVIVNILKMEAKLVLAKYKPKIVAVTGSVGKTSTKDAVYAVISEFFYVRKSEKSYNSQIGLPLTVLGIPNGWNNPFTWIQNIFKGLWLIIWPHNYPKWLVLEVGVGKPGDMKETASWLKTDVVIITAIGSTPAHIEFFNSRKHLVEEKSGLIKTLKKDGLLVLNGDDETVVEMKSKTKCRTVIYGFKEGVDFLGSSDNISYSNETSKEDALKDYSSPAGRMKALAGINNTLIIDDTYNSSPFACESALNTLKEVKTKGRKIAVLGDMLELGKHTEEAHKSIGRIVQQDADVLCVVGPRSQFTKQGALESGMGEDKIFEFADSVNAGEFLKTFISKGDIILIKGSQGMRMERTVGSILLDQENKRNLIVRQDKEWISKK